MIRRLSVVFLFSLAFSCHSSKINSSSFGKIAGDNLGTPYTCELNADSTFALCKSIGDIADKKGLKLLTFVVIALKDNSIVYSDKLQYAEVTWINDNAIMVERGLGYMNGDSNATERYIVDLKTLERRSVSDNIKKN